MNSDKQKLEKITSIAGIIIGIAAVVIGIIILFIDTYRGGNYTSEASFGADFYTYIYDAVRTAANNTSSILTLLRGLALVVKLFCSTVLIGGGIFTVLKNIAKVLPEKETAAPAAPVETAPVETVPAAFSYGTSAAPAAAPQVFEPQNAQDGNIQPKEG